ncbi:MAG: hypothetical protein AB7H66_06975 [Hyphomonadaceae bacterium]
MTTVSPTISRGRISEAQFFVFMAITCALLAFGGFAITYWAPLALGTFRGAPVVHLHGLLFSAWVLFFALQASMIASGQRVRHRALGLFGIALATAMVFVGTWTALHSLRAGVAAGYEAGARAFATVPLTGIAFFAVVVGFAIANVKRPETHMRLMLLATISILQAAAGRITRAIFAPDSPAPGQGPPPPLAVTYPAAILVDLLLLAAIIYDWRTRGRPHPVYLIGGAVLLLMQFTHSLVAESGVWNAALDALLRLAG